ncbi:MAG: 50S ribosomal protein L25 [Nitrospirota bacterium]
MEKVILKAAKRVGTGKGNSRQLRSGGILPGVLYSGGSSTSIQLQKKEISKLMGSKGKEQALISIELEGDKASMSNHWALIKDYQLDPVKNELLHVDFIEISLKKKIKLTVPIVITKEPIGVKNGGILQQQMREVKVECLPTQIPDGIEVDASSLDIGHSLHVSDLVIKEGVKILSEPQEVILSVIAPAVEEVAPVAPAAEEIKEPELVKKTKTKEEEAEEAPKGQKEQKESKTQKEK